MSGPSATDGTNRLQKTQVYHLEEQANLKVHVVNPTKKIKALKSQGAIGIHAVSKVEIYSTCFVYGGVGHQLHDFVTYSKMR